MSLLSPSTISHLTTLYSEPTRHYHNLSHVQALLNLLTKHRSEFHDPEAVQAAIWFHDAIYDPRAKGHDNELQSAVLAVAMLTQADVDPDRVSRIKDMIEATASHKLPSLFAKADISERGVAKDLALFLDMDLSILGAEAQKFDEYEENVRKEYPSVDDQAWRTGRADVLRRLLGASKSSPTEDQGMGRDRATEEAKKFMFHTELFRELFEERARKNIKRSLRRLNTSPVVPQ